MGGQGSGRILHYSQKGSTCYYRFIDIRRWFREGLLVPGKEFILPWKSKDEVTASISVLAMLNRVVLSYRYQVGQDGWKDVSCPVILERVSCHLGGKRLYFLCPGYGCDRRAAILYLRGGRFACRICHDLVYPSQGENELYRSIRRLDKVKARLDWEQGLFAWTGLKPKGMHWKTYNRLVERHDRLEKLSSSMIHEWLHGTNPNKAKKD